jgi:reverse transcriptase-like protein
MEKPRIAVDFWGFIHYPDSVGNLANIRMPTLKVLAHRLAICILHPVMAASATLRQEPSVGLLLVNSDVSVGLEARALGGEVGNGRQNRLGASRLLPQTVGPLPADVLAARMEVKRSKRRAERLARPAYVNTDASWQGGLAGLAYDSWALGQRVEFVRCVDSAVADHMALLMAMEDADRALPGSIVFRVDSTAVVLMSLGKKPHLEGVRARIETLLERHRDWSLVLIEGYRNRVAHSLSRRPFLTVDQLARRVSPPSAESLSGSRLYVGNPRLLSLPAGIATELHPYVCMVLGEIARRVAQAAEASRACRPGRLAKSMRRYSQAAALLDRFERRQTDESVDLVLNLRRHGWALGKTIDVALKAAESSAVELDQLDDEHLAQEQPTAYAAAVARVARLRDLAATIGRNI